MEVGEAAAAHYPLDGRPTSTSSHSRLAIVQGSVNYPSVSVQQMGSSVLICADYQTVITSQINKRVIEESVDEFDDDELDDAIRRRFVIIYLLKAVIS